MMFADLRHQSLRTARKIINNSTFCEKNFKEKLQPRWPQKYMSDLVKWWCQILCKASLLAIPASRDLHKHVFIALAVSFSMDMKIPKEKIFSIWLLKL